MAQSESAPRSYERALRAVPYAVPAAAGVALLAWGLIDLVPLLSGAYGILPHWLGSLLVLAAGSALIVFAMVGAIAVAVRPPESTR